MWTLSWPAPPGVRRRAAGSAGVCACVQTRVHAASPGRDRLSVGGWVIHPHFPDERPETWSSLGTNHTNKAKVEGHMAARPGVPLPVPLHLGTGDQVGVGSNPAAFIAGGHIILTHLSVTAGRMPPDSILCVNRACAQRP